MSLSVNIYVKSYYSIVIGTIRKLLATLTVLALSFMQLLLSFIFPVIDVILQQARSIGVPEGVKLGCRQLRQNQANSTFYGMKM